MRPDGGKLAAETAEVLKRKETAIFHGFHNSEKTDKKEALPKRPIDIAKAHQGAHTVIAVNYALLGLLPLSPVMHGTGLRHHPHFPAVIMSPVAPVIVLSIIGKQIRKQADLFHCFNRHQPMCRHYSLYLFYFVILSAAKNLSELSIKGFVAVCHLKGA